MQFIHSDLGQLRSGDLVEVTLSGSAANVRLLDSSNFTKYRAGKDHRCIGGLAKRSPVRLEIPRSGRWHVAIDMHGLRGTARAAVRVVPQSALRPLPEIPSTRGALEDIARNLAEAPQAPDVAAERFDVFISHAGEDKERVVRPLAIALQKRGVSVWYDEFTLRIGDSLRRKIDSGIAGSRFGIVVLSTPFFAKDWPQYELDGLVTMALTGKQILLPLWHEISADEVMRRSPSLADKVALKTVDRSIEEIADEISAVIIEAGAE